MTVDIISETRALIKRALQGDPALASLAVVGRTPDTLTATISPGIPPGKIGRTQYSPAPPFSREVLADLALRAQRRRWQRYDPRTASIPDPVRSVVDARLHDRLGVWPEHRSGWCDLIEAAVDMIEETGGDPRTSQIKEKFGDLRWYTHGLEGVVGGQIVDAAEHLSACLCEKCGALGRTLKDSGWYRMRCGRHEYE